MKLLRKRWVAVHVNIETFVGGGFIAFQLVVGTSIVPLSSTSLVSKYGVWVKAPPGNTGIVYVGGSDVATGTGYPLSKNESIWIQIDHLESIFFVASASSQGVSILAYK